MRPIPNVACRYVIKSAATSLVIPATEPGSISTTILQPGATFGFVGVIGPGSVAGVTT